MMRRHRREVTVALAIAALALLLLVSSPAFFSRDNLADIFLANMPVLIVAVGMTLIILTGQIDISVGSVFAICGVTAGLLAKAGLPLLLVIAGACLTGAAFGALTGALVAFVRIPSIVATLATMVALRDGLRWATDGAWIQDLPSGFQWLGLSQHRYPVVAGLIAFGCMRSSRGVCVTCAWAGRSTRPVRTGPRRGSLVSTPRSRRLRCLRSPAA